jgi:hypothetical protein
MASIWDEPYVCNPYSESDGIIGLSSGNPESKRDMKGTKEKLTTRTIIIVPIAFLSKHEPAAIRQRSTKSMCHDGEAS